MRILIANGPNLNLLGEREPNIYGRISLDQIETSCVRHSQNFGWTVDFFQSNDECEMIERIHGAEELCHGIIINAGAWTHTSIAIYDALSACPLPAVEVHLSNIWRREAFRQNSYVAKAALGSICGFGEDGYLLALEALYRHITNKRSYRSRKASASSMTETGTS